MGNGKSTDERLAELEQTVAYLSRLVLKAREYAEKDPEVALGQARKSAEAICYRLFQVEIGHPGKMMLEDLITKLQAQRIIPPHVVIPLRTIQLYGNFGAHAQERHEEVSVEWVAPCLSALAQVTNWYFRDYLGIALPTELERHEDHFRSVPRHGGRETEPRGESTANPNSNGHPEGPITAIPTHFPFAGEGRGVGVDGEPWTQGPDPVAGPAPAAVLAEGLVAGATAGETRPDLDQTPVPGGQIEDAPPPRSRPVITTPLRLAALAGVLLLLVLGGLYLDHEMRNDTQRRQDQATAEAARQAEAQAEQQQLALAAEAARAREKARAAEAAHQADLADYTAAESIGTADAFRTYLANCAPKGCTQRAEAQANLDRLAVKLPAMVRIAAGSFTMGSPAKEPQREDDEGPQHQVQIAAFELGKTEVTRGQFKQFVQATGYRTEAEEGDGCFVWKDSSWTKDKSFNWRNVGFAQGDDSPVVCVTWNDAQRYVGWLSQETGQTWRLPTEAEWEYAARAGTTTPFSTGNCISTDQANYNGNYDYNDCGAKTGVYLQRTQPVRSYPANRWGLYEMHGNVWEWVEDCYHDSYTGAPTDGSAWMQESCPVRVLRSGSWIIDPSFARAAFRGGNQPEFRNNNVGFRLARTLSP
jgi:formylglycine-generating enzyme required for sulfatase activity